eukprot:scaffold11464_cov122-Amphora_coffeaeformis.AAC.2
MAIVGRSAMVLFFLSVYAAAAAATTAAKTLSVWSWGSTTLFSERERKKGAPRIILAPPLEEGANGQRDPEIILVH